MWITLGAVQAQAQTDSAQSNGGGAVDQPTPSANIGPAPLQAVSGPFRSLYGAGVLLSSAFYDDLQGNPVGGLQRGEANAAWGTLGADADLDKLVGIPGGRFHLLLTYEFGDTLQQDIGNFIKSQDSFLPFQKTQLAQLAYEQSLFGGRLDLYGGRVSATSMFAHPTFGCDFISGSQCPYDLPVFTGGFSGLPYSTWGGRARVNLTSTTYIQAGGFSVDPDRKEMSGFNLGLQTATGVVVPVEVGYETSFDNDDYPRHYKFGGWYNNAPSTDPLLNTHGQSRALFGGAPLTNTFGRGGLYGLADQVIYRPDSSQRNLAVFGSFAAPFDQREILTAQNTLGVYDTGPLASRPHDTAGFMVTQVVFTNAETQFLNQLLEKNGSSTFVRRDQFNIEANYGVQVVPGLTFTPNVEYIINPDTTQRPDARFAPRDALVVGIRLTLNLNDALGLPQSLPPLR
jgi:porin